MKHMINFIPTEILAATVIFLMLAAAAGLWVIFVRRPDSEKKAMVQEWLLWAVASAESWLGSGTGEKKLALVYRWFGVRFPLMSRLISFEEFQSMVDDALEQLETFLMDDAITEMMIGVISNDE